MRHLRTVWTYPVRLLEHLAPNRGLARLAKAYRQPRDGRLSFSSAVGATYTTERNLNCPTQDSIPVAWDGSASMLQAAESDRVHDPSVGEYDCE
jgi:hypothetical protein